MDYDEIGVSGLKAFGGVIDEEWDKRLRGAKAYRQWREIRDSYAPAGAVNFFFSTLFGREPRVRAAGGDNPSPSQLANAQFLREVLGLEGERTDMTHTFGEWVADEAASALWAGWSWSEAVYMRRLGPNPTDAEGNPLPPSVYNDGRIGLRKLALRGQDTLVRWDMDEHGAIHGWWQRSIADGGKERYLPISKGVLIRFDRHKNNPEGRSIYRNGRRSYIFASTLEEHEAISSEKNTGGMLKQEVPLEVMQGQGAGADGLLTKIKRMLGGFVVGRRKYLLTVAEVDSAGNPTGYRTSVMEGGDLAQHGPIITRHHTYFTLSMLMNWVEVGMRDVGAFALHKDKTNVSVRASYGLVGRLYDQINRYVVTPLQEVNAWQPEDWAWLEPPDFDEQEVAEMINAMAQATGVGLLVPDSELEEHVREKLKAPQRERPATLGEREGADGPGLRFPGADTEGGA